MKFESHVLYLKPFKSYRLYSAGIMGLYYRNIIIDNVYVLDSNYAVLLILFYHAIM